MSSLHVILHGYHHHGHHGFHLINNPQIPPERNIPTVGFMIIIIVTVMIVIIVIVIIVIVNIIIVFTWLIILQSLLRGTFQLLPLLSNCSKEEMN